MRVPFAVVMILAAVCSAAQDGRNLLLNGDFAEATTGWVITADATCTPSVADADVGGAKSALRLVVRPEEGAVPWAIHARTEVDAFLGEGDWLVAKMWMRSPDECRVTFFVEIGREPHAKSIGETVKLGPEWQEYEFTGQALADYSPGELHAGFHLGFGAGTIEIADVRLLDLDLKPEQGGERPTMEKPQSLIENGDLSEGVEASWYAIGGDNIQPSLIDADVEGYDKAARLQCAPPEGGRPWEVQFGQGCDGFVHKGDAVYFRAWLRSPDKCRVSFIYEMGTAPHSKYISQLVRLTPDWQEYRFMGRPDRGFRPGESQAKLFLGYDQGVVEIAGVGVENYGRAPDSAFDQTIDYWAGREHPDTWRQPALERIEQLRKGDLTVKVVDAEGRPVPQAKVTVEQRRHHFRFGTCLPAARLVDTTNPDNLRFQQEVERLFNTVTFENDLKWPAGSRGRLQAVQQAIEWLQARAIAVRGHCLLWGSYRHLAPPVRELRGEELLEACRDHVAEYAALGKGKLYLWDVVNEAGSNVEIWDEIGWEAFADSFRWARAADPEVLLCYNDYGIVDDRGAYRAEVAERIRYLLDNDAPVDALGIQAHMTVPLTPIHRVVEILDEWAEFGRDLEITEFDIGIHEDEPHGEYVRDFMVAAFSHPRVTAFIMWGFWEGSHWRAKHGAAMFRGDWSKRPAQEAYEDLVLNRWWTKWDGETSGEGVAALRAFYGRQEVSAEHNGKRATATIELTPEADGVVEIRFE